MKRYEEVEHTADWSFRAFGRDIKELYENAAYALFALEGVIDVKPTLSRSVNVQGIDREALMVNWLNELLFLQETRRETYQEFEITNLTESLLEAQIRGDTSMPVTKFIKAVTYHDLRIEQTNDGWQVQLVVDV